MTISKLRFRERPLQCVRAQLGEEQVAIAKEGSFPGFLSEANTPQLLNGD